MTTEPHGALSPRIEGLRDLAGDPSELAALFGGKTEGLVRLLAAGVAVPEGFAAGATTAPPSAWDRAVRDVFAGRAAELLERGPIVVRSSAVGEDSAEQSFAGLFETVAGVTTTDGALRAAERCIASGGAARVLTYASSPAALPVGLVVQRQIDPRWAGVCFTRDPTGRDHAVVVEAVRGSGEQLVSGTVDPECWRIYRSGLGGWECRVERRGDRQVLDEDVARLIADGAADLAARLGRPLDLEWAVDVEGLWWLQARPITAAVEPPTWDIRRSFPEADDGPVTVWSNWNVRETMPEPFLPLTWSFWREEVLPMVVHQLFGVPPASPLQRHLHGLDLVGGRLYFNMNALLATPVLGPLVGRLLSVMDERAGHTVRDLTRKGVLRPRRLPGSRLLLALRMARTGLLTACRMIGALRPGALAALEREARAVSARGDLGGLSPAELLREMRLWASPACRRLRNGLQMEAVGVVIYGLAARAFRRHPRALERLATGIPANPTTQISLGIDELVELARPVATSFATGDPETLRRRLGESAAGRAWLAAFDRFLDRVGHRGPMEFDLGARRWSEDPSMILALVRAGLAVPPKETAAEKIARLAVERRRAVEEAVAASSWWRRPWLRRLARWVELYMPLREAPKHHAMRVFERVRLAVLELGRRLTEGGVLAGPEDVFLLDRCELEGLARGDRPSDDLADLLRQRRQRTDSYRSRRAPDFVRSDGVPVDDEPPPSADGGVLRGTAVSAGCGTGPVRVLRRPDPDAMEDGDVLVLEYADPGWTPLFPRAAAVVMEVGGLMCHAAVVARELGIPAVFGVRAATELLRDGDVVRVEGGAGIVVRGTAHGMGGHGRSPRRQFTHPARGR